MNKTLFLLLLSLGSSQAFAGDIYQCVENGVTKFSQQPCGPNAKLYTPKSPLMETQKPHSIKASDPILVADSSHEFTSLSSLKVSSESCELQVVNGHYQGKVKNTHRKQAMEARLKLIFEFEKEGFRQGDWDKYLKLYRLNPGQELSFDIRSRIMPPHSKVFCRTEWKGRLLAES